MTGIRRADLRLVPSLGTLGLSRHESSCAKLLCHERGLRFCPCSRACSECSSGWSWPFVIFFRLRSGPDRHCRVLSHPWTAEPLTAQRRLYKPHLVRVLLETLPVPQLVKELPAFYGPRKFMAVFTKSRHSFPEPD